MSYYPVLVNSSSDMVYYKWINAILVFLLHYFVITMSHAKRSDGSDLYSMMLHHTSTYEHVWFVTPSMFKLAT